MAGLVTLPTQTDGSLGRAKQDLEPVPELDHYVTAAEWNKLVEAVVAMGESIGLADGSTPGSLVRRVWKWNETDIAQFGAKVGGNNAGGSDHAGTVTLSIQADSEIPDRKRLRFALSNFDGWAFFPITGLALPARFAMRAKLHIPSGSGGANEFPSILLVTNLVAGLSRTALFGYCYDLNRGVNYLLEAGVRITTGAPGWSAPAAGFNQKAGALHDVEVVRDDDPNGQAEPRFSVFSKYIDSGGGSQDAISSDLYSNTFAAGWSGLTLNRAGIGVMTGSARSENIEIAEIAFYKHPMDE